jgi:hypothetical protein
LLRTSGGKEAGTANYEARPNGGSGERERSEILLITDDKTILLDMGHDGKFSAKSASWEENKVILPGDEIVIRVDGGRWFIVKQKQAAGGVFADRPVIAAGAADEILEAPVTTLQGPVAPQPPIVASQPSTLALSVAPQPTLSPTFGPRTDRAASANEKASPFWAALGLLNRGYLFALTGEASGAVRAISEGLDALRSTGSRMWDPFYSAYLAYAHLRLGQVDDA